MRTCATIQPDGRGHDSSILIGCA